VSEGAADEDSGVEEGAAEADKFPLGSVLTLTGINVVFGVVAALIMRRRMPRVSGVIERYVPPAELLATIETLRAVASRREIDPNDPLFELLDSDDEGAGGDADAPAAEDASPEAGEAQHDGAVGAAGGAGEATEGAPQPAEAGGEGEGAASKSEQPH
jgi:hypothetical protein